MVIDTSAILAVLLNEPEADSFRRAISDAEERLVSAVSALEATCVLETRYGESAGAELELLIFKVGIRVVAFDDNQLNAARKAWRRFGRGRHAAALNFGDCASYALARATDQPLLYKGRDFAQTDIRSAV